MLFLFTGAHTLSVAECQFFLDRFYNFLGTGLPDPDLDLMYDNYLRNICPDITNSLNLCLPTWHWTSIHSLHGSWVTSRTWDQFQFCCQCGAIKRKLLESYWMWILRTVGLLDFPELFLFFILFSVQSESSRTFYEALFWPPSKFGSELLMMMREHENKYQKFAYP